MTRPLRVSRFIKSPPERVFAAWTDPDQLLKWWGPRGVQCARAEMDGRKGGTYRIDNRLPDGSLVVIAGRFLTWDPPSLLSYTWWVEPGAQPEAEHVTVHFAAVESGTNVTVIHERIVDPAVRKSHRAGWEGCLEGLDLHFPG